MYAACSKLRSGARIDFVVTPPLKLVQTVLTNGMDVEYGDGGGRGQVGERKHRLEEGEKQRNGGDKGSCLYAIVRHVKIIITARISRWDCEGGNTHREDMKGASGQTRWIYLEVHTETASLSERRTAGTRVTGCVRVRLVTRTSDNPSFLDSKSSTLLAHHYGTQARHIKTTCPYGRWGFKGTWLAKPR